MKQHRSARFRAQNGNALVEGALVLLPFIGLMIAICDVGLALHLHQSLSDRVRAAARYGALRPYTYPADDVRNVAVYNHPNPPNGSRSIVTGLTTDMVRVDLVAEGTDAARIRVTISNFQFPMFSPWIARRVTARPIIACIPYERGS